MDITTERRQESHQNRWLLVLQGLIAVLFGAALMLWPKLSLGIFVYLFGAFALIEGIIVVVMSFARMRTLRYWWALLIGGLLSIGIGLITLFWPAVTAVALLFFVAAWAIVMGVTMMMTPLTENIPFSRSWPGVLAGILAFLIGIYLFLVPVKGILSLTWLIGLFAIIYGIFLLIRAILPGSRGHALSTHGNTV